MATSDRSVSRGREVFSSGRGGVGNIRQSPSSARDTGAVDSRSDSISRGREPTSSKLQNFSIGRGGAGNIRSPSRDVDTKTLSPNPVEEEVLRCHTTAVQEAPQSSGRGGAGNIHPRSPSRNPPSSAVSLVQAARKSIIMGHTHIDDDNASDDHTEKL